MNWLLERLKEENTWRGLVLLATAAGVKLDPERGEAIIALGLAIVGFINVMRKDNRSVPGGRYNPGAEVRRAEAVNRGGQAGRGGLRKG